MLLTTASGNNGKKGRFELGGRPSARMELTYLSDLIWVYPDFANGDNPWQSTDFSGKIILDLTTSKRVTSLCVELVGHALLFIRNRTSTYTQETILLKQTLFTTPRTLPAGRHEFPFAFAIPAETATYIGSLHSRISHELRAKAGGIGKMGGDLLATERVIVAAHTRPSEMPTSFFHANEAFDDTLGPVRLALSSKYLLVAGYMSINCMMPHIQRRVIISDVQVVIEQLHQLVYFDNKTGLKEEKPPPQRINAFSASKTAAQYKLPRTLQEGESFELSETFRLPLDNAIDPSTFEQTDSPARISHFVKVVIRYMPVDAAGNPGTPLKASTTCSAHIFSCCCMLETLQLPVYSREPEQGSRTLPESVDLAGVGIVHTCLCKWKDVQDIAEVYGVPENHFSTPDIPPEWKETA